MTTKMLNLRSAGPAWIWLLAGALVGGTVFFSGRATEVITDVTDPGQVVFILRAFGSTFFTHSGPGANDYPRYVIPLLAVAFPAVGALLGWVARFMCRHWRGTEASG